MSIDRTLPQGSAGVPIRRLRVEVLEGSDKGETVEAADRLSIGSEEGNDLVLHDETVSRFHAELSRSGDRILVRDCGSTNGTQVGPAWVETAFVSPGVTLKLGRSTVRVSDGETVSVEVYSGDALGPLIGRAPVMRKLMARVRRVAESDASVLIIGETGAGKEVIARALHELSPRADQPFETVDCGAMVPTLLASELFGHEKGSFTGADKQHIGAFERADGGTLFLDEIGELPASLQANLLGALERRSFRRLGGKERVNVNVRVVSATNRDLRAEVNGGSFRADLYYRLAVVQLAVPALRERLEDLPLLAEHFLRQAGFHGPISEVLPEEAMAALTAHRWPGNVRELRNVVEAAWVMGETPELADAESPRPAPRAPGGEGSEHVAIDDLLGLPYNDARGQLLDQFEGAYLEDLLRRTQGNVAKAARIAKMNRSYLNRLIRKRGIQPPRDEL